MVAAGQRVPVTQLHHQALLWTILLQIVKNIHTFAINCMIQYLILYQLKTSKVSTIYASAERLSSLSTHSSSNVEETSLMTRQLSKATGDYSSYPSQVSVNFLNI